MATSNPVWIRLSDLVGQTVFAQALSRFDKENLRLDLDSWEAHPARAIWSCSPGSNHPSGLPYSVNVQARRDGVWGVCSCAADRLCKHLAAGFVLYGSLVAGHLANRSASCPGCVCPVPPPPPPGGGLVVTPTPVRRAPRSRKPSRETVAAAALVDRAIAGDRDPWEDDHFCTCGAVTIGSDRCDACLEKDRLDIFG
jgi:hypothetical protein